jgi:uncharacterized protein involved in type VI secretion and phage assembly
MMRTGFPFPNLTLTVDGEDLLLKGSCRLVDIRIQQRLSLPALCALTFLDPKDELCKRHNLSHGKPLELWVSQTPNKPLFQGELTTVEYIYSPSQAHAVSVRAYDRLYKLQKSQRMSAYQQVTVAELAKTLVSQLSDHIPVVNDANPGPIWPRVVQGEESDLEFLRQTAVRAGRYFGLRHDGLHIMDLAGIGQAISLILGESLFEARIEENSCFSWQSVSTKEWNPLRVKVCQSAPQISQQERMPHAAKSLAPLRQPERMLSDVIVYDNGQAEAIARAELERLAAREVSLWGVAEGNPELQPGNLIDVQGIAPEITGQYVLTAVNHLINPEQGYVSEISTVPPDPPISAGTLVTWGTVTDINDPETLGRVQVALPGYNDGHADWLQVVAPGAGANKGLMAIPAIGDLELVIFPHGRLEQGIVLGGLYGQQPPPDEGWGIQGSNVMRHAWRTPGGQKIQLDDEHQRIRLNTDNGSEVDVSSDKLKIHAETDMDIEAAGKPIVIGGRSIDFKRK